jgi:phosphoribosylglycinamide formyltransferase 1
LRAKEKIQVAVFCSGFGSNLEALLKAEKRGQLGAHISLVVCDRVKAAAIQRALKHKRAVFCAEPKHYKNRLSYEKAVWNILKQKKIGLVVLAGFMRILTPYLIRAMKGRMVNVHPSLLPEFKGAHAIKDAFDAGVKKTGVTVHWVTPQLDSGPIILK